MPLIVVFRVAVPPRPIDAAEPLSKRAVIAVPLSTPKAGGFWPTKGMPRVDCACIAEATITVPAATFGVGMIAVALMVAGPAGMLGLGIVA